MKSINTTSFYRLRLPHWEVDRGVYFITMRLSGTLPLDVIKRLKVLVQEAESEDAEIRAARRWELFQVYDDALDKSLFRRDLQHPDVASICMEAIHDRVSRGIWDVSDCVIMPNHLHLLILLKSGDLFETMWSFKRWTSGRIRKLNVSTRPTFWQREWFDHWSRSPQEDEQISEYIRDNPVKAKLVKKYGDWPYGIWNGPKGL